VNNVKNMISIDFGTSRTKMAHYDEYNPKMELFRIGEGEMPYIPTVFYLSGNGERYLGDTALEFIIDDPLGFLEIPLKRCIRDEVILTGNGQKSTPVELLSLLFKTLRKKASQKTQFINNPPTGVVLTIPVRYGPADEDILKRAAINAGFDEHQISFIHEPVAAAQAWFSETKQMSKYIVVLDCGGGTLDWACLRQKQSGGFEIVAELPSDGDTRIGGYDIDEELYTYVRSNANEDERDYCRSNRARILHQLRGIKERYCKTQTGGEIRLSKQRIIVSPKLINDKIDNRYIKQTIKTISPYLDKVRNFIQEPRPKVLMVGGSSRLTKLREVLQEECACDTIIWERSEFATVLGAINVNQIKEHEPNEPKYPTIDKKFIVEDTRIKPTKTDLPLIKKNLKELYRQKALNCYNVIENNVLNHETPSVFRSKFNSFDTKFVQYLISMWDKIRSIYGISAIDMLEAKINIYRSGFLAISDIIATSDIFEQKDLIRQVLIWRYGILFSIMSAYEREALTKVSVNIGLALILITKKFPLKLPLIFIDFGINYLYIDLNEYTDFVILFSNASQSFDELLAS
jgi:actin-like ATPase involved in cell morphogenesis